MSKKRKTRKEKMKAAARHDFSNILTLKIPVEIKTELKTESVRETEIVERKVPAQSGRSYTYVSRDIRNTLNITSALIALNVIIYFILKLKFINIPGIGF